MGCLVAVFTRHNQRIVSKMVSDGWSDGPVWGQERYNQNCITQNLSLSTFNQSCIKNGQLNSQLTLNPEPPAIFGPY
jgi:hypothetical protein